ncbi:MAG TPA: hypothetical protein VFC31_05930 [Candidatus Limnocylindria bacterium]|nr:hypothetical protein [Candidatus Limnocylindria bacterium]
MTGRDGLIEETVLRRALRLDVDERAPRFARLAIAALAPAERPSRSALVVAFAVAASTGLASAAVWSAIAARGPDIVERLGGLLLDALIAVATLLVPAAEIAAQPAVPLSLLAALGVAIAHELRERKEHAHAHAS